MTEAAAIVIAVLVLVGAGLSLLGAFGLVKLKSFYDRVHAPTLGTTLGMLLILTASWLFFGLTDGRWLPRELLIALFLTATTPVTLLLLARAALFRDRTEQSEPQEKPVPLDGD
jgi:multicomponent K+:H+ antiporter subunit G